MRSIGVIEFNDVCYFIIRVGKDGGFFVFGGYGVIIRCFYNYGDKIIRKIIIFIRKYYCWGVIFCFGCEVVGVS